LGIGLSELLKLKEEDPELYRKALYELFKKLNKGLQEESKKGKVEIITDLQELMKREPEEDKVYIVFIRESTASPEEFDHFGILVGIRVEVKREREIEQRLEKRIIFSTKDLEGFERIENPPKLDLLGSVLLAEIIKLYLGEITEKDEKVKEDIKEEREIYRKCLLTLIRAGLFRKRGDIKTLYNFINEHINQKEISGKAHFQLASVGDIENVKGVLDAAKNEKRLVLIFNNEYKWFVLYKWSEERQKFEELLYQMPGKLKERLDEILGKSKSKGAGEGEKKDSGGGEAQPREVEAAPRTEIRQSLSGPGANLVISNSEVEGDVKVEINYNPEELKQILESYLRRAPTKEDLENFAAGLASMFEMLLKPYYMGIQEKSQNLSTILSSELTSTFNLKYGKFLVHLGGEFTKNLVSFVLKSVIEKVFYEEDKKTLKRFQSPEDIAKVLSEYIKVINTEVPKAIGHELLKKLLEEKVKRDLVKEFFREHHDILENLKQAFEKEGEVVLKILGKDLKYGGEEKEKMKDLINGIYKELAGSKVEEIEKEKKEKIEEIRKEEAPQVSKEETPETVPSAPPKEAPEGKPSEAQAPTPTSITPATTSPPPKPITSPGFSRILNTCGKILGWTLIAVGTPIIALGLATALLPLYALYTMKDQIKSITPDIGNALKIF
jgi:hypothetical protein